MAQFDRAIVSFEAVKESALYFNYVIPLGLAVQTLNSYKYGVRDEGDDLAKGLLNLLPPRIAADRELRADFLRLNLAMLITSFVDRTGSDKLAELSAAIGLPKEQIANSYKDGERIFTRIVEMPDIVGLPTEIPSFITSPSQAEDADVAIQLAGMRLIDADRLSWAQILEFRKDANAQERLRRFRLFASESYHGKTKSFIEDDILCRIEDYEQTVKEWGFETFLGSANTMLNSNILKAAGGGTFVALLAGQPLPALLAGGGGVAIEIGKLGVELARRQVGLRKVMRESPFSYFTYAKTKFSPPKKNQELP